MFTCHKQMIDSAYKSGKKRFAIAGATRPELFEGVMQAVEMGFAEPVFVGDERVIQKLLEAYPLSNAVHIHHTSGDEAAARKAVEMVVSGEADILMKGNVDSKTFLKIILQPEFDLKMGELLSHTAILEIPSYHKLLLITDGGMVISPDFKEKVEILKNSIHVMHALGIPEPKIAILTAVEKVNSRMPETEDAAKLTQLANTGVLGNVIVEGPLAIDLAFSKKAADIKQVHSQISEDVDIVLVPDIACGNIFAKGLVYLAGAKTSGLIVGVKIPVVMLSRADSVETRVNSMALGHLFHERLMSHETV